MLPTDLKILLGEVEVPPQPEHPQSKPRATIDDWLKFNGLTREAVVRQLELIDPVTGPPTADHQSPLGMSSGDAWALCASSLRVTFPDLVSEIDKIEAGAPRCLRPKAVKHPKPFTCSIPDDHISPRRSALFMARSVLKELRDGVRRC